jgi:hypothetical protein
LARQKPGFVGEDGFYLRSGVGHGQEYKGYYKLLDVEEKCEILNF